MSGCLVTERIRQAVQPLGPILVFKAYMDANLEASKVAQQHELLCSGVSLIHTPHNGKKEVADKILLVDLIIFAIEGQGPATVVLITGDRDFSYALSVLRLRGHEVVLISPTLTPQHSLPYSANVILDWKSDILKHPEPGAKKRTSSSRVSSSAAPPETPASVSPLLAHNSSGGKSLPIEKIMRMRAETPKDVNVASEHTGIAPVAAEDATRPAALDIRSLSGSYFQSFEPSSVENRSASSDLYSCSAQKKLNDCALDSLEQVLSSYSSPVPNTFDIWTPQDESRAVSSPASSQDVVSDVNSLVGTVSDAERNVFVADTPDTSFCEDIGNANIDCGFTVVEIDGSTSESDTSIFEDLIKVLVDEQIRKGESYTSFRTLRSLLHQENPDVYRLSGVAGLKDYLDLAYRADIVSFVGYDYISKEIYVRLQSLENMSHNRTTRSTQSLLTDSKSYQLTAVAPPSQQANSSIHRCKMTDPNFVTLVDILREWRSDGVKISKRNRVASEVRRRDPVVFVRSGHPKSKGYIKKAETLGFVMLTKEGKDTKVALHPKYY